MFFMVILKNISFYYQCKKHNLVINDFSYIFKKGNLYWVTGDNASGKTTLLHIVGQFLKPKKGDTIYNGGSKSIGMVFQNIDMNMIGPTIGYEIDLYLYKKEQKDEIIKVLNLHNKLDMQATILSFGEKKFFYFYLVLFSNKKIKIFDEPFVYMDEEKRNLAYNYLKDKLRNNMKDIIIIADRFNKIKNAEKMYEINLKKWKK